MAVSFALSYSEAMECRSSTFHWKNFAGRWFWMNSDCEYVLLAGEQSKDFPNMPNIMVKVTVENLFNKYVTVAIGQDTLVIGESVRVIIAVQD